jgi:hypothetical protein
MHLAPAARIQLPCGHFQVSCRRTSWVACHPQFFLDSKLNLLLLAFPLAIVSKAAGFGDGATFVLAMLALCPLAEVCVTLRMRMASVWVCLLSFEHA